MKILQAVLFLALFATVGMAANACNVNTQDSTLTAQTDQQDTANATAVVDGNAQAAVTGDTDAQSRQ